MSDFLNNQAIDQMLEDEVKAMAIQLTMNSRCSVIVAAGVVENETGLAIGTFSSAVKMDEFGRARKLVILDKMIESLKEQRKAIRNGTAD